jgi:hypothetical protein
MALATADRPDRGTAATRHERPQGIRRVRRASGAGRRARAHRVQRTRRTRRFAALARLLAEAPQVDVRRVEHVGVVAELLGGHLARACTSAFSRLNAARRRPSSAR